MNRILCIGNRLWAEDSAGPAVFDALSARALPGVELVDGGVAGLGLLRWFEGCDLVVLVDGVEGFGQPGEVVLLPGEAVAAISGDVPDHGAGLPYLLAMAPRVCVRPARAVLVGIEGAATTASVGSAAALALSLAMEVCHAAV